jgi:CoA:oxalate CoA-transferase
MFIKWCAMMRRGDLRTNPRYATAKLRKLHLPELLAEARAWIQTFTDLEQLQAQVSEAGLAIGVVRTTADLAKSEWARDWGAIVEVDDREGGTMRRPGAPWRFSESRLPAAGIPYFQGESNDDLLAELGVSATEAARLRAAGVTLSRRSPAGAFD